MDDGRMTEPRATSSERSRVDGNGLTMLVVNLCEDVLIPFAGLIVHSVEHALHAVAIGIVLDGRAGSNVNVIDADGHLTDHLIEHVLGTTCVCVDGTGDHRLLSGCRSTVCEVYGTAFELFAAPTHNGVILQVGTAIRGEGVEARVHDEAREVDTGGSHFLTSHVGIDIVNDNLCTGIIIHCGLVGVIYVTVGFGNQVVESKRRSAVDLVNHFAVVGSQCVGCACVCTQQFSSLSGLVGTPCEDVGAFLNVLELGCSRDKFRSDLSQFFVRECRRIGFLVLVKHLLGSDSNLSLQILAFELSIADSSLCQCSTESIDVGDTSLHLSTQCIELGNQSCDFRRRGEVAVLCMVDGSFESSLGLAVVGFVTGSFQNGFSLLHGNSQLLLPVGSLGRHGDEVNATEEQFCTILGGGELQHIITSLVNGEVGLRTSDIGHCNVLLAMNTGFCGHILEACIHIACKVFQGKVIERSVTRVISEVLPCTHADGNLVLASIQIERNTFGHFRIKGSVRQQIILYLLTVCQGSESAVTIEVTPVDGSTVEVAAVACHGTAATAIDIATPVVVPDIAIVGQAILVDGAIIVSQPTHGECAVSGLCEGLVGAVNDLG